MIDLRNVNHGHICCGIGAGAKGFNRGQARVGNMAANFRCLGGIDVDPACVTDFERLTGAKGTRLDLMTVGQYAAFHGRMPPPGFREAVPDDIRRAFRYEHPHILFMSMPCKGFSGLLSERMSLSPKYQALNGLTLRGLWLALEAYQDDPVELILFENVPRIATRGRWLLNHIMPLLDAFDYEAVETKHDCGELGALAQHRERFLIVARHRKKVPAFLYQPKKLPVRGVGEVLEKLPLPGLVDAQGLPLGGPMHRVPRLQWKTWVRLAFVEAGKDWRSLNKLRVENGMLADYGIAPDTYNDAFGVCDWTDASGVITGHTNRPSSGKYSVADPRIERADGVARSGANGVLDWDQSSGVIAGESFPSNGAFSVADPRVDGHPKSVQLGVRQWDQSSGVVTGKMIAGGGPNSVADPRIAGKPRFNHTYRIVRFDEASPAIAGPGGPAGGLCVADPRPGYGDATRKNVMRVGAWSEAGGTVTTGHSPSNGAHAVADPRFGWHEGASSSKVRVTDWNGTSRVVTGSQQVGSGAQAVADPRAHGSFSGNGKYRVTGFPEAAGTVIGNSTTGQGAFAVADPRPVALSDPERNVYLTGGHYGVVDWREPSGAVPAHAKNNNGPWSVADPRITALPGPTDNLVCMIRALDGTWHRPFTTLECAALQSLVDPDELFDLSGTSDSAKRERIGNAVPSDAAAAIASMMGQVLLLVWSGESAPIADTPVWVRDIAVALSVKPMEFPQ